MGEKLLAKNIENNQLRIRLGERIDTVNSTQVRSEIEEAVAGAFGAALVLDAEQLKYISSAGLRMMLTLQKQNKDMQVINVCRDVYDIFEMTGFTSLLNITKAYRQYSVEGLSMIGWGTCGKVYRLDEETIIKVFNPGFDLDKITKEQNSARTAFVNGIDTAISYDVVKAGDCFGIVYEMLEADTIRSCMKKEPDKLEYYIGIYAGFMKNMHHTHFGKDALPEVKNRWIPCIDSMGRFFDDSEKALVKKMFEDIPDRDTFIHGDYNIGNLMCQNGKGILIDMGDASTGHPIYDLLGVYLGFKLFPELMPPEGCVQMTGFGKEENDRMWEAFCREYFDIRDEAGRKAIEEEIRPYSAFRVLQAALTVNVFPEKMLDACRKILMEAAGNDGRKALSF